MGKTIKIIENGSIIMNGLHKARIGKNELSEELRVNGFRSLSEVEQGFLEPSGKLSLFGKENRTCKIRKIKKQTKPYSRSYQ